jgi:outer membrane lipoprotein-sorting protein
MAVPFTLMRRMVLVAGLVGLAAIRSVAAEDPATGQTLSPLQALTQTMTSDELFARLLEHNRVRDLRLQQYSGVRKYEVTNDKGKVYAEETVQVEYRAPDRKTFVTESEKGSKLVRDLVLKRLIESESETSSGRAHRDSSIKPANYEFDLLGEQDVGPYHCLVVDAVPRRKDKYLFEGRIWIDAEDYAIVRIAGHPAKSPSFWITRADFVRSYQRIGEFWLPAKDETVVRVRLNGTKLLTIHHRDYTINGPTDARRKGPTGQNRTAIRLSRTSSNELAMTAKRNDMPTSWRAESE